MVHEFNVGDTVKIISSQIEAVITKLFNSPRGRPKTLYLCQWTNQDGKIGMAYFDAEALELMKAATP